MIYETLLYKEGHRAIQRGMAPPTETLSPRCNDIRGCINLMGCWRPMVNKLDLKWRSRCLARLYFPLALSLHLCTLAAREKVSAQWAALAETVPGEPPSTLSQPRFFQQFFSPEKPPQTHAALQRVLDKEREMDAEFGQRIDEVSVRSEGSSFEAYRSALGEQVKKDKRARRKHPRLVFPSSG